MKKIFTATALALTLGLSMTARAETDVPDTEPQETVQPAGQSAPQQPVAEQPSGAINE